MKKIALLFCLAQTVNATSELTFSGLKSTYYVGECVSLELQENSQTSRFHRVDLWVGIQTPSSMLDGQFLFMTPFNYKPFALEPQAFQKSLEATQLKHQILPPKIKVLEGMDGIYTFYAVYVEENKSPLTDGNSVYQSNLAQISTTLSDELPLIPAKDCAVQTVPDLSAEEAGEVFRDTLEDGSLGPEMVKIPAGSFKMGNIQGRGDGDEQPVHRVSVNAFAMGRYEVTFEEYDRFADATGREKPDDEGWGRGNRPVMSVSWEEATAYTVWLSTETGKEYRLPTEAEWEYAARAGTETKYWWGNEIGKNKAVCDGCGTESLDAKKMTAPVGSFAANPFGLYDVVGNLWEWTCSEYETPYNGKEKYCGEVGSFVRRGGSWDEAGRRARLSNRSRDPRTLRLKICGFRLARVL